MLAAPALLLQQLLQQSQARWLELSRAPLRQHLGLRACRDPQLPAVLVINPIIASCLQLTLQLIPTARACPWDSNPLLRATQW